MRRGLFFFLMVVLVLRGLTGTAMAAGVLAPLSLTQAAASHAHGGGGAPLKPSAIENVAEAANALHPHEDSAAHSTAEQGGHCADPSAECHPHEHPTCSACEICHSAMLAAPSVPSFAYRLQLAHGPHTVSPLHSAPAALLIKPPIA